MGVCLLFHHPKQTLDEVEDAEVALLLVHGEDEVERGVVPVDELHALAPLRDAGRVWRPSQKERESWGTADGEL